MSGLPGIVAFAPVLVFLLVIGLSELVRDYNLRKAVNKR